MESRLLTGLVVLLMEVRFTSFYPRASERPLENARVIAGVTVPYRAGDSA
jgi:hypothetical protein